MEVETQKYNPLKSLQPSTTKSARETWKRFRLQIESSRAKSNITRYYPRRKWILFTILLKVFGLFTWLTRFSVVGGKNALDLKLNTFEIELEKLPIEFDGFQIAHLSDIHFDRAIGVEKKIVTLLDGIVPDLIAMTGDYKDRMRKPAEDYDDVFRYLAKHLKSKHGIFATLGNHDSSDMVPVIERQDMRVLLNESVEIEKGSSKITITGVDDVHYFYSPQAMKALDDAPNNNFKILLVHSPEMVLEAEQRNFSLYLCGHTHGGQICTPGGKPIVTHINTGKQFSTGRWTYKSLEGYTTSGAGVSGLTLRFFTQSEIALIRLKCKAPKTENV